MVPLQVFWAFQHHVGDGGDGVLIKVGGDAGGQQDDDNDEWSDLGHRCGSVEPKKLFAIAPTARGPLCWPMDPGQQY